MFAIPLFGGDLLQGLYGPKWLPSIAPLHAFGIYAFARSFGAISGNIFLAQGKTQYIMYNAIISLSLFAIFIYPVATKFGILGVAWLYSGVWLVTFSVLLIWLKKVITLRLREIGKSLKFPLTASILIMLPLKLFCDKYLPLKNLEYLIVACIIIIGFYYLLMTRFDPISAQSLRLSLKERKLRLI
jgi:O-antigen/teichoic acid export membrane protein